MKLVWKRQSFIFQCMTIFICATFWGSCASKEIQREEIFTTPHAQVAKRALETLRQQYKSQELKETYIQALERFLDEYSDAPASEEAKFLLAQVFFKKNDIAESYTRLKEIDLQRFPEARKTELLDFFVLNARQSGDDAGVVQWSTALLPYLSSEKIRQQVSSEIEHTIIQKLERDAVEALLENYPETYPAPYLYLRMGKLEDKAGNAQQANDFFRRAVELASSDAQRERIREFVVALRKNYFTQRQVIGCILPLTGKYGSFGARSLRGIQQAFHFFDTADFPLFELAIYDSEGDAEKAAAGVDYLLESHGVIGILGPLLSGTSESAARRAEALGVPMINLSQHESITTLGAFIFRTAMTIRHQVEALVEFACEKKGFRRFAILYPEDRYGIEFANLFWNKVEMCGGMITAIEAYRPDQQSFNDEVKKLVGLYQPKARKNEYQLLEEQAKIELDREEVKESDVKLSPQIDFEALFIPDYAKTIGQIAPTLAYYDVEDIMLLGTQGWHSPWLLKRGEKYVEGVVFVDTFFQNSDDPQIGAFVKQFHKTFGYLPDVWEAQAYDAANLLVTLFEQEEIHNREDFREKLKALSSYRGITGEIFFREDGDVDKKLFLLTVKKRVIQPYTLE